ncbi:hypothetical protein U9M48_031267, partial [Paspalum notatum var. saurae]
FHIARVRSTARPATDSEAESTEETHSATGEETPVNMSPTHTERDPDDPVKHFEGAGMAEDEGDLDEDDNEDGNKILRPQKPSHWIFGISSISEKDFSFTGKLVKDQLKTGKIWLSQEVTGKWARPPGLTKPPSLTKWPNHSIFDLHVHK